MEKSEIENQRICQKLVEREVYCNATMETEFILRNQKNDNAPFSYDDIQNLYDENDEPNEVLEWWYVTNWFGEKLGNFGQPVIDCGNKYIWGRCTSGQMISMDGVIRRIAEDMEILVGQKYSWEEK